MTHVTEEEMTALRKAADKQETWPLLYIMGPEHTRGDGMPVDGSVAWNEAMATNTATYDVSISGSLSIYYPIDNGRCFVWTLSECLTSSWSGLTLESRRIKAELERDGRKVSPALSEFLKTHASYPLRE